MMLNPLKINKLKVENEMIEIKTFLSDKVIDFNGFKCYAKIRPYNNGHVYMHLHDCQDDQPIARVSLMIDEIPIVPNMIIVKSYSENDGMYESLLKAGIVKPCERKYPIGNVFAHICFFNI